MDVFAFTDYKILIKKVISDNEQTRGYQSKLAAAAGCQKTYLSQVLHSEVQLTPDHAANLCGFWHLNEIESQYFLDLVNLQRSGSPELRRILQQRLDKLRQQGQQLTQNIQKPSLDKHEAQTRYYGVWYMAAIHVLASIPQFQSAPAIATHLRLTLPLVEHALAELSELSLVTFESGRWRATGRDLHLPNESLMTPIHHLSWRQRSLMRIQEGHSDGIHYTALHALSRHDARVLHSMIRDCIMQTRKVVAPSPEEVMVCFTCDYFPV